MSDGIIIFQAKGIEMKRVLMQKRIVFMILFMVGFIASATAANCSEKNESGLVTSTCIIFITRGAYHGDFNWNSQINDQNICNGEASNYYPDYVKQGIKFKALLGWNNATTVGVNYYRPYNPHDPKQVFLATASGPNLARNLANSISDDLSPERNYTVWTGFNSYETPAKDDSLKNCRTWTSKDDNDNSHHHDHLAMCGSASGSRAGWDWENIQSCHCKDTHYLICVAQ